MDFGLRIDNEAASLSVVNHLSGNFFEVTGKPPPAGRISDFRLTMEQLRCPSRTIFGVTSLKSLGSKTTKKITQSRPRRYAWAELLKRVFAVDALKCNKCGSSLNLSVATIARGLGAERLRPRRRVLKNAGRMPAFPARPESLQLYRYPNSRKNPYRHLTYIFSATSENLKLCAPCALRFIPHRQLIRVSLCVNSAFGSAASLDFGVFGGCLSFILPCIRNWRRRPYCPNLCRRLSAAKGKAGASSGVWAEARAEIPPAAFLRRALQPRPGGWR